ncbi:MAG: glycosyltransferase family 2 protein [Candidatus Scalindua sp. AMX11]|nr:MAG: glycosyltransferase family 2 protein [Candidatus Scalindua sp.]NOG82563.1 glycosyltransferase family 2 protein [Planctomycetota bacterium]RZV93992.1 MAG: glycosyltransferase family 2 protein [Candidatus Scalindua sp. SCAELEC01]TDE63965.1 MAG: glycosyltransferase family 2 protein [Candidatus Scalindua sp. AMX11]GJQ57442.1 MAG: glycosyl transferase [Candidatus Scalindua sp.]
MIETSIITPVHNSEKFLKETLDSILCQTYTNWESIIINDNSNDNSLTIIEKYTKMDNRFKLINRVENGGAAVARNIGIQTAKGRFIAFLDSDDVWMSNKLEEQIKFMKMNSVEFCYSNYFHMTENGQLQGSINVPKEVDYNQLLDGCIIGCLTAIYDTKRIGKVFMPELRKRQDYGLWLAITKQGVVAKGIQTPLAKHRKRKASLSSQKLNTMLYTWKLYREIEGLSIASTSKHITKHLLGAAYKRFQVKYSRGIPS